MGADTMADVLDVAVDRSAPIPLYQQLVRFLEIAIDRGELAPGDRVASEIELARLAGVSRVTSRRAIQELVDRGVVVRKRGVGTQVLHRSTARETTSPFDLFGGCGPRPVTRVLDFRVGTPSDDVRRDLCLPVGAKVVRVKRLRSVGGEPLSAMVNWLPATICPTVHELETDGLYRLLRSRGMHIGLARETIRARVATRDDAVLLAVEVGSPLLSLRRTAFDRDGRIVEIGLHTFPAERYWYATALPFVEGARVEITCRAE
ncbi:GntR family transcriptional regulator [Gordonia sp. CPCC 205515]|uniref:GntR family transcriptional regulator n=1 Tax=Gordonia sp. CPCC 205515 TaxID=3140791 RepID=UPI003AF40386